MSRAGELSAAFSLAARLRSGEGAFAGWVGHTDAAFVDAVARTPLDAVVLDMQHGFLDVAAMVTDVATAAAAGKPTVVRVPVGAFATASRALDVGAAGVIAPMIDGADQARRFVEFVKYPPRGGRSWGAGRAMALAGVSSPAEWLASADGFTLAFAMIETREGLAAIDEILAVEGIDGVFVGPNDLCIALTDGATVDPEAALLDEPLARITASVKAAGKVSGIFGGPGARAGVLRRMGFDFVTLGWDVGYVQTGIAAMLAETREVEDVGEISDGY